MSLFFYICFIIFVELYFLIFKIHQFLKTFFFYFYKIISGYIFLVGKNNISITSVDFIYRRWAMGYYFLTTFPTMQIIITFFPKSKYSILQCTNFQNHWIFFYVLPYKGLTVPRDLIKKKNCTKE